MGCFLGFECLGFSLAFRALGSELFGYKVLAAVGFEVFLRFWGFWRSAGVDASRLNLLLRVAIIRSTN